MPGVNPVAPRVQGGLLDAVMKGVSVARDIYGIKHDMAATDAAEQASAQSKAEFDDKQAGIVGAKDRLEWGRNYEKAADDNPAATVVKYRTGPGDEGIVTERMIPKAGKSPLMQHVQVAGALIDGKHGTAVYDPSQANPNDPKAGLIQFVETPRPDRIPKDNLMTVEGTDESGNKVIKVVPKVAGAEYATTKGDRKDPDQNALYTKLTDKIDNFRGDKAAQQASVNLLSADNALKLVNKYADLNQMSTKDYNLLVDELGKIATGGVPGVHTQESIAASTLESKWSEFTSTVGGKPSPAQLGEFIKNNVEYLHDLRETSQDLVDAHNMKSFNGLKRQLDDEHIKNFQEDFPDLWARELARKAKKGAAPAPGAPAGGPGMAVAAPAAGVKPEASLHPEVDAAAQYVKENINSKDPVKAAKAKAISDRLNASDQATVPTMGGRRP